MIVVAAILATVYQDTIVGHVAEYAETIRDWPGSPFVAVALLVSPPPRSEEFWAERDPQWISAIPPLVGQAVLVVIVGLVWGMGVRPAADERSDDLKLTLILVSDSTGSHSYCSLASLASSSSISPYVGSFRHGHNGRRGP